MVTSLKIQSSKVWRLQLVPKILVRVLALNVKPESAVHATRLVNALAGKTVTDFRFAAALKPLCAVFALMAIHAHLPDAAALHRSRVSQLSVTSYTPFHLQSATC